MFMLFQPVAMFYHIQLENDRKNELSVFDVGQKDDLDSMMSYLSREVFNWDMFSQVILSTLLEEKVHLVRDLRPYLSLTTAELSSYCDIEGFSLKEYVNLKQCNGKGFGRRNKCSQLRK
jgi:hypothetical protein